MQDFQVLVVVLDGSPVAAGVVVVVMENPLQVPQKVVVLGDHMLVVEIQMLR